MSSAFEKVGHRRSLVISTVCIAALVRLSPARDTFETVRLGLAAVGPVPTRLTECEAYLKGRPVTLAEINQAAALPVERVQSRSRQVYRREVLENFVRRALVNALAEQGVVLDDGVRSELNRGMKEQGNG